MVTLTLAAAIALQRAGVGSSTLGYHCLPSTCMTLVPHVHVSSSNQDLLPGLHLQRLYQPITVSRARACGDRITIDRMCSDKT